MLLTALSFRFFFTAGEYSLSEKISRLLLTAVLFTAACTDRTTQLIPNRLILPAVILRFLLYLPTLSDKEITAGEILLHAASSLPIPLVCLVLSRLIPKGLGMGDIKLMLAIAFYLPFWESVSAFFYSFLFAAAAGLYQAFIRKMGLRTKMPLAPFFLIGTVLSFLIRFPA